ncbi:MAG TPA: hypothetical protein VK800_12755 [Steroidobacteraceae bacterium]|jgi:hypothetical protein|nr:hypothetical protein [Steroidobacteraceae bacterium]
MQFALQFGHGMMKHSRVLVREWGGGSVILSPRDLSAEQMVKLSADITDLGGFALLDPQLYVPDCDHARLTAHSFWPQIPEYWRDPAELARVMGELVRLNSDVGTSQFIAPAPLISAITEDLLQAANASVEELARLGVRGDKVLATVALASDAVRNEDHAELLSDAIESWDVAGIYLVAEHPSSEYLVTDPMWLARILDIVAGARLTGKQVVIGYCTHQMLIAAAAGANTIASGTWMNVRSFPPKKFAERDEEEISRRATWYYAPHLLSEYKKGYLDIARNHSKLSALQTPAPLDGRFAAVLFSGAQPTTVDFGESDAFRHYLHCLWQQTATARQNTFRETVQQHEQLLNAAEATLRDLHKLYIVGQGRDFLDSLDANRAALALLTSTRGPILEREWSSL